MTTISVDLAGLSEPLVVEVAPTVSTWLAPLPTLYSTHPRVHRLLASACVIRRHNSQLELLCLQRREDDSFPLLWEIPGGCAEPSDPSVIHAAIRELFEETGLRARRVVGPVGLGAPLPLNDVAARTEDDSVMEGALCTFQERSKIWGKAVVLTEVFDGPVVMTEHAAYRWVSRDELRTAAVGPGQKDATLRMVCKSNKRVFLEAFEMSKNLSN